MRAFATKMRTLLGDVLGLTWVCKKCGYIGLTAYEYCPKCGTKYQ